MKYKTTEKHVEGFVRWKYHLADLNLRAIKYEFVTGLEFYLRTEKNLTINSYGKIIKNLKKIIHECVAKEWLSRDPFVQYKVRHIEHEVPHLIEEELQKLRDKEFDIDRLALVKDLFLFSCFTGLAYVDAANLTREHIVTGPGGKKWLMKNRQKTDVPSKIPLLAPALEIIEKYSDYPMSANKRRLLPVMSNQKVNSYLKEIADLCGIRKKVTFHVARHTFATTVTLSNGIPIETVSKMLGHKKLQTTQIYAKVVDVKIGRDMEKLEGKF